MSKNLDKFIKGSISAYLNMIITILISIFSVPIMINSLGKYNYGLWVTISSIFGFMVISDLGIGQAASKLISEKENQFERDSFIEKELVSTTFFTNLLIGSIVLFINILLSFYIYKFLNLRLEQRYYVGLIYGILAFNFFIGFVFSTFRNILLGYKYLNILNIFNIFRNIINFISLIVLFKYTNQLYYIGVMQTIITLTFGILNIIIIKKLKIKIKIKYRYFSKKTFRRICVPGVYYLILQISGILANNTDNLILNYFISASVVAVYSTAFKMTTIFTQMVFAIVDNLFPFISEIHGKKDWKKIKSLFLMCEKFTIYVGVFIMFIIVVFGKSIMNIWIGKNQIITQNSMILFAIYLFLNIFNHGPIVFLQSMYKHNTIAKFALTEAILNVILSIIFVRYFGAMGVIMGTVLADIFMMFWYATIKTLVTLKIGKKEFIKSLSPAIGLFLILSILTIAFRMLRIEISDRKSIFCFEFFLYLVLVTIITLKLRLFKIKKIGVTKGDDYG